MKQTMHKEVACRRSNDEVGPRGTIACKKARWWACWAPVAGRSTAGINFNHHLKYSDEGLLPCIVDIASGEQGSDVQGENGFTSVQKWGR